MFKHQHYDILVMGGGPAGMMAAGTAARHGARVGLLEKNDRLGVKLLLTGKGRCNLTRAEFDLHRFIEPFGQKGKFLYSVLHRYGVEDTLRFFHKNGVSTKVERGKRVFPVSDKAADVLDCLSGVLKTAGVIVMTGARMKRLACNESIVEKIVLADGEITARKYILCTGGLSYPSTGSSGDGLKWAEQMGHALVRPQPALVPLQLRENVGRDLQGLSLKNVRISLFQNKNKQEERFGEALFTHEGMSGPIILDMSKRIGELLTQGPVGLQIDFKPALSRQALNTRIRRDLLENKNKMFRNSLDRLLPQKLIPFMIRRSGICPDKQANSVTRDERKKFLNILKGLELEVRGLAGFDQAIVTAGGVSLDEVDSRTMQSKRIQNLFFAGEILDLDGPTGGYNLQVCWSTGYVAGKNAVDMLR